MCVRIVYVLLLLFSFALLNAQEIRITGRVTDTLGLPLERANVMAMSDSIVKFGMADQFGQYKLELKAGQKYKLSVSYIGYQKQTVDIPESAGSHEIHFKLIPDGRQLDEVAIHYEYKPVEFKKDTILFNVGAFTSGTERKLKDIIEKLPGMEVDENGLVSFQGNQINTTLVENKKFFGGGSKLAVNNIPADAVGQIEIISHFTETAFMKDVLGSDQVAMNVKLKADKKRLFFGDLEAAGSQEHYHGRGALFFFTPEESMSFIGDVNNAGSPAFTLTDMIGFQVGISHFLNRGNRPSFTDLSKFTLKRNSYSDASQFSALNFNKEIWKKWNVSGFAIFSNHDIEDRQTEQIEYLVDVPFPENRRSDGDQQNLLALFNIKVEHSPTEHEKMYYNGQVQLNDASGWAALVSDSPLGNQRLQTGQENRNIDLAQYFEWHKGYNARHTTSLVVNHTYQKISPSLSITNNQPFLSELLDLVSDTTYRVKQVQNKENNHIGSLFKHYWKVNGSNQFDSHIAVNHQQTVWDYAHDQLMSDGSVQRINSPNFENTLRYQLSEVSAGIDYNFDTRSLSNTASLTGHIYYLELSQEDGSRNQAYRLIIPRWKSEYEFNEAEKLILNYEYANAFPAENDLNSRYLLQAYHVVSQGSPALANERFHTASLRYFRFGMRSGTNVNLMLNYIRKANAIRNGIDIEGIEQVLRALNSSHPETNLSGRAKLSRNVGLFQPSLSVQASWFEYSQTINRISTIQSRQYQSYTFGVKTLNKSGPIVSLDYTKGYNRLSGRSRIKITNDLFHGRLEYRFLPKWVFQSDVEYYETSSSASSSENPYWMLNGSLRYELSDSPWSFTGSVNNALNNQTRTRNSISDYLTIEQVSYVLPRILLLGITYKL